MSGVSSSTDFSNCTSFGGRNADPVETGTDGVEVVDGRPGVCCCGFFRSGVSSGGLLPGFDGLPPGFDGLSFGVDGLPPGVGFGGVLSGRVGVGFGGVLSGRVERRREFNGAMDNRQPAVQQSRTHRGGRILVDVA